MVEPVAFGCNPETVASNAYQDTSADQDATTVQSLALAEHRGLQHALVDHGVTVTTIKGQAECPDDLFPNNWVSTHAHGDTVGVCIYPMLAANRRLERRKDIVDLLTQNKPILHDYSAYEANASILKSSCTDSRIEQYQGKTNGFKGVNTPVHNRETACFEKDSADSGIRAGRFLEGTGSIIFDHVNRLAYAATSPRTDVALLETLCRDIGYRAIPFEANDHTGNPIYHTNVMMFIGSGVAGICSGAIHESHRQRLMDQLSKTHAVIDLDPLQLLEFCGNALEVESTNNKRYLAMSDRAKAGFTQEQKGIILTHTDGIISAPLPTIERYGGGSARCMMCQVF